MYVFFCLTLAKTENRFVKHRQLPLMAKSKVNVFLNVYFFLCVHFTSLDISHSSNKKYNPPSAKLSKIIQQYNKMLENQAYGERAESDILIVNVFVTFTI